MKLLVLLLTITLYSCNTKEKIDMKWESDKDNKQLLTCISKSKNVENLSIDLEKAFQKLKIEKLVRSKQILFYVDGTNGYIFISGYDSNSKENYDESGIFFEVPDLWEETDNSILFDEIIVKSIKATFKNNTEELFYQTELYDAQRIKD